MSKLNKEVMREGTALKNGEVRSLAGSKLVGVRHQHCPDCKFS